MAEGGAEWVLQRKGNVVSGWVVGEARARWVTRRLDGDVLDRFRAGGPGWQSRINAVLRGAVGL